MALQGILFSLILAVVGCQRARPIEAEAQAVTAQNESVAPKFYEDRLEVERGSSVALTFKKAGLNFQDVHDAVRVSKEFVNLNQIGRGAKFVFSWRDEARTDLARIVYEKSPVETIVMDRSGPDMWQAARSVSDIETRTETFAGTVEASLWESADKAGMDPNLIGALAEIFAWQVDFAREVRSGDRWRLTVEKKFVNGQFYQWGNILAAEYQNQGETYTGVRFPQTGERGSYYFPDGSSLKRMFLKSPLKISRITSPFNNRRFHPIYKRTQPHNGVDYGAPTGTPVMSVGNGTVDFVGRMGAAGKMVRIRHNGTYQTAYCHLSGYAKNLKKGMRVDQGQIVGYVGSTGAATGPHLHFAFYEGGRFVDPLGKKFPSADPVSSSDMSQFSQVVAAASKFLPDWQLAQVSTHARASLAD